MENRVDASANRVSALTHRTVFFVSDQTGVTAETLGRSLLTQFDGYEFKLVTLPFVDSLDKVESAVAQINQTADRDGERPIVFGTLVQDELRPPFAESRGLFLDFFQTFVTPLETELQRQSTHISGRAHGMADAGRYDLRIEATNYALTYDDGSRTADYDKADVILVGVSRSGKTPTCLYLALTYGVFAANYPLSEDELEEGQLPACLQAHRGRLFGLTIEAERLQQIRKERRATGRYASPQQVRFELRAAEDMFRRLQIPFVDTTHYSVEEIASNILTQTGIERRVRP